jgi:hypothetical protein
MRTTVPAWERGRTRGEAVSPAEAAVLVEVHRATDADVAAAVAKVLESAGLTLDELSEQARTGRFESDRARRAWFLVTAVGRAA